MATELSHQLQLLVTPSYQPELSTYLKLLDRCVELHEFQAAVFVFDQIKSRGWTPTDMVYTTLERLHSKTLPEFTKVKVPIIDPGAKKLQPRRRIHKIIKGWRLRRTNQIVDKYLPKVKGFLECHSAYKSLRRVPLANHISYGCGLDFETSRRIVTKLRQTGYLPKESDCYLKAVPKYGDPLTQHKPVPPTLPISSDGILSKSNQTLVQSSITQYF